MRKDDKIGPNLPKVFNDSFSSYDILTRFQGFQEILRKTSLANRATISLANS